MTKLEIAQKRSQILQTIRNFFNEQNFTEVETPIMVPIPGMEPHLTPFETEFQSPTHQQKLYLNTSPELQMKKLLGQGFTNIYNISKVFRNGEAGGPLHNPEFTMLEWYRTDSDYTKIMEDCEKLISLLDPNLPTQPWPRKTTQELFLEHCKIDINQTRSFTEFQKAAAENNYDTAGCTTWDDIFFKLFLNHIEPKLTQHPAIFVTDYPASQAALARLKPENPFFAERFELYLNGIEIANAFSELTDSKEQHQRLQEEQEQRRQLQKTVFPIDEEFLAGLESIHKPCAGIALGIDRLIMFLLKKKSIQEVLLFPYNQR